MDQKKHPKKIVKTLIILYYILIFWLVLPGVLIGFGLILDNWFSLPALPSLRHFAPVSLAVGLIIFISGAFHLIKYGKGLPISSLPPVELVETGPYALFRHPLYIGFHGMLFGGICFHSTWGLCIVCGPLFLVLWICYALLLEEPRLMNRYGKSYLRYRKETNLLLPDFYSITTCVLIPFFRIVLGLKIIGGHRFPKTGGFFFIAHHRSYLDPFIFAAATRRKIHYLTTSSMFRGKYFSLFFKHLHCVPLKRYVSDISAIRETLSIVKSGGAVGIFPEGGRSWLGESAWTTAVFAILEKADVPVVWGELEGGYDYFPRFSRKIIPLKLTTRYFRSTGDREFSMKTAETLYAREKKRDLDLRTKLLPLRHRGLRMLLFRCPECGTFFSISYYSDGQIVCRSCGEKWRLLIGKGIINSKNEILTLADYEKNVPRYCKEAERLKTSVLCSVQEDFKAPLPAELSLESKKCIFKMKTPSSSQEIVSLYYHNITAVLIEGRKKLEIGCRNKGPATLFSCRVPKRYAYFLQSAIRLKAFGDLYTRHRGSRRVPL